jgi:predicted lysophospholipase L1 biosynthesis ABC-type transport system permease subunit
VPGFFAGQADDQVGADRDAHLPCRLRRVDVFAQAMAAIDAFQAVVESGLQAKFEPDFHALVAVTGEQIEHVVRAVQFLFVFTLAAGVVVLYAALASSRDERIREAALMRALGASRRQLQRAQMLELGVTGALSGLLAAFGAIAVGAVILDLTGATFRPARRVV